MRNFEIATFFDNGGYISNNEYDLYDIHFKQAIMVVASMAQMTVIMLSTYSCLTVTELGILPK